MSRTFVNGAAMAIGCLLLVSMTTSPSKVHPIPARSSAHVGVLPTLPRIVPAPPGREPVYAKHGMVVSSSAIASEIGRDILKQGGNAIDAAVATAFAMAVTWPSAGNIGGGGFILYVDKNGKATSFDFREKAPLTASETMFLDSNGKLISNLNHRGILSVGTPGTVAGLFLAHQRYGKLPWKKLVDPAVKLAAKGFVFTHALMDDSEWKKSTWTKIPSTAHVMYRNDSIVIGQGENWKQPELASTLKRIRDKGHDGFYKGETAKRLAQFMSSQGGLITEKDLAEYQAIERKPIEGNYRGNIVYSMPPPSSGGVALVEMLNILEGYDLKQVGYASADYIHLLKAAMQRAFADRAEYMGDPDFNPELPVARLTSKQYAAQLKQTISFDKASPSDSSRFGQIYDGGNNTTHFSVVDNDGNAVALTYTLENSYGSQIVADGLGFFLNDEMGDFNPMPGVTTNDGQIGTKPNLIRPGKRMLSSMTPTILVKDGKPLMVIGTPGGRTIINSVLQVILNVIDHQMNIAEAVEAPRFHHQWLPDCIYLESLTVNKNTQEELTRRGNKLKELPPTWYQGAAMGIYIDRKSGYIMGGVDSRSPDAGGAGY
ncbi:gamma-glutamyltransferase [Chryseolinea sp. T2]|uniref:gamma-glutamyltransferase n=1 Tax=Chryseolinea sp. T2 TaxID=3129255 RepID=UPI003077B0E1